MMGEMAAPTNNKVDTNTSHSVGVNVTTKVEPTGIGEGLALNPWHFRTIPGILQIVQLVIAILCMGCGSPVITNYTKFFMFVVAFYFIFTLLVCLAYFFTLKNILPKYPWLLMELLITASAVVLYFIAAVVQLAMTTRRDYHYVLSYVGYYGAYVAAGVISLFNVVAYGLGALFLLREWRESRQATSPSPN